MRKLLLPFLCILLLGGACKTSQSINKKQSNQSVNLSSGLSNRWILNRINDQPIEGTGKDVFLEFRLSESRFFGNAGCNSFNGPAELEQKELTIGAVMSTKKFCPGRMKLEDELTKMLDNSKWTIALKDNRLTLSNEKNKLEFTRGEKEK